ncbi:MAG: glycosyltransferase [Verrucomicrobiales bacterium]|nr:glycosyltransferase [Verrucomicrobiales bacterium]
MSFETDEQMEVDFYEKRMGMTNRMGRSLKLLVNGREKLKRASHIYCYDGLHFNLVLFFQRVGLFKAQGKCIRRFAFRSRVISRSQNLMKGADPAFAIEFITNEQVAEGQQILGADRARLREWKIDTNWFRGVSLVNGRDQEYVVPGTAFRNEDLVMELAKANFNILRLGRPAALQQRYAEVVKTSQLKVCHNLPHSDYRSLLGKARAVLLPIVDCDEPAGFTAALEAIAMEVPLIASNSLGIDGLLKTCDYPIPSVSGNSLLNWKSAIGAFEDLESQSGFAEKIKHCASVVRKRHSIGANFDDWIAFLRGKDCSCC